MVTFPFNLGVTRNKHFIGQWIFFIDLQWNRMLAIAEIYDRMVTNRHCFVSLPQLAQFFVLNCIFAGEERYSYEIV
jgi:hypothetical protein